MQPVTSVTRQWMTYESPLGPLLAIAGPRGLSDLNFPGRSRVPADGEQADIAEVREQLDAYFAGELQAFDLELDTPGPALDREVWRRLTEIPYGETWSYGELAERVDPDLFAAGVEPWQRARIVGSCNGRNPVSIIVPCHRVIGADGSLTGYGGGLQRKQALLDLERDVAGGENPPAEWAQRQTTLL